MLDALHSVLEHLWKHNYCFAALAAGCLNSVKRWNGMERNGMSAALPTHVLQPTDDLILNCTSHTMIAIAS